MSDANETLMQKVDQLPTEPGVYLFRDARGALLYVGKARSLRARVRSYFQRGRDGRLATFFIEKHVADVEFLVTRSEKEALLLENNLIKKMKPRYNLRLRDDKTFLSLRLDPRDAFPRIVPVRRIRRDGALYFGPYANAGALRRTLRFLRAFVPLRDCKDSDFRTRTRPCLEHEIGRCSAPCVGLIAPDAYARDVERAVRILRGDGAEVRRSIRDEMDRAAENLQFERAAALRDHLKNLDTSLERQEVDRLGVENADVVGIHREGGLTEIVVLAAREGKIVNTTGFTLDVDLPRDELLGEFLHQFYGSGRPVPEVVLVPEEPYGRESLEEWLRDRREAAVELKAPVRGERARLLALAAENARLTLLASTDKQQRTAGVLANLRAALGLRRLPGRIDCIDASTTAGKDTVASCVTFKDGEPWKTGYRRFRIRNARPDDEYAAISEVVQRRYRKLLAERALPDLIVIDGGKGQWNAARAALDQLGAGEPDLISFAKGARRGKGLVLKAGEEERVFTRGAGEPLVLDQDSEENRLLQRIRDEAHRFAITYHRLRRSGTSMSSALDEISGVGKTTAARLLRHFGDVAAIRAAPEDALAAVDGVGARAARAVFAHFHARGDGP